MSRLALLLVAALAFLSCRSELDEVDCQDLCEHCLDDGFPFDTYKGTCDADPVPLPEVIDFDLFESTIADVHQALLAEEITCEWLIHRYIDRALWYDLRMNPSRPPLNTFVHLNRDALNTARALDDYQRCEGELSGPLHCIPFGIKDNFASQEVPITSGSLALLEAQPTFDAFTVEALRRAGGVMLGSTAMDELARGVHGLSGRSGKTGNPYDTRYNSGGSSGGSAAATTANLVMGALGTDNCSSLIMPAAYNNVYTMRSSIALVSTQGIYPSNRVDMIAGPFARTVTDLAIFFDVLSRMNPRDRRHCEWDIPREQTYLDFLDENGLQGRRVGVLRSMGDGERHPFDGSSAAPTDHFDAFFAELESLGAEVIDPITLPDLNLRRYGTGQGVDVDRFLKNTHSGISSHVEFCETELFSGWLFDDVDACLDRANQTERNLNRRIRRGEAAYEENREYVQSIMDHHDLDVLVQPADTRGAPSIRARSNNCVLPSITGLPTASFPTGFDDSGLPIGMLFTARLHHEATLFSMLYAYESATDHRRPPPGFSDPPPPPVMTIDDFHHLHFQLGLTSFEEYLRFPDKYALTHTAFRQIAERVFDEEGFPELLP